MLFRLQAALDVLVLLVRGCGGEGKEVPRELVTECFPRVVKRVLMSSDDTAILQVSGASLSGLTLLVWITVQP